ncbi:hypothetical protein GETHPA_17940 [Geothrix rubra]|uniref:Flagellar hook-length control protein FliK n=1 Tax=Geothrix rubra TaxID=2927977 RepID=A0ABQ5Q722_9BACT|nr:hypothetical protein [Geothrix rubra]GLH70261.1 hypothetical protein GETHPA_17940 [Geothrix rubra]
MDIPGPLVPLALGAVQLPPAAAASVSGLDLLKGQLLEAVLLEVLPDSVRLQLPGGQELRAQGQLPFPAGSLLALKTSPLPGGAGLRLQVLGATPPPTDPVLAPLAQGEAAPLLARLQVPSEALRPLADLFRTLAGAEAAATPEGWATLLKAVMTTLSDAVASPREAPFHALQAQEGTALFEIPLPWAPGADPMRIWVEADAAGGDAEEPTRRVFLSVPFSALGEVRLGVERNRAGLRARLWLEDPSRLEGLRAGLEAELSTLGVPATLQLLPLPTAAPDLRALAGGSSLSALG